MMTLAGVELVSEPDALTTRPPPCVLAEKSLEQWFLN